MTPIMENFSINTSRGRPRKWTYGDNIPAGVLPDNWGGMCRRSQVNFELLLRCGSALGFFISDIPEREANKTKYGWLYPFSKGGCSKQGKNCILYALGRIDNEETIRQVADVICESKYNLKQSREFLALLLIAIKEEPAEKDGAE